MFVTTHIKLYGRNHGVVTCFRFGNKLKTRFWLSERVLLDITPDGVLGHW